MPCVVLGLGFGVSNLNFGFGVLNLDFGFGNLNLDLPYKGATATFTTSYPQSIATTVTEPRGGGVQNFLHPECGIWA